MAILSISALATRCVWYLATRGGNGMAQPRPPGRSPAYSSRPRNCMVVAFLRSRPISEVSPPVADVFDPQPDSPTRAEITPSDTEGESHYEIRILPLRREDATRERGDEPSRAEFW